MTLDNIEATEESLVDELRRRVKGQMSPELYEDNNVFIRFLRARNHNINAAETMLKNDINWRRQFKIDKILTEYTPKKVLVDYIPVTFLQYDYEESPIAYFAIGNLDTKGILKSVTKNDISMFLTHYLENESAKRKIHQKKKGVAMEKSLYILDFQNFSLATATHKPTLETFAALVGIYEAHYPEKLKYAFAINASYYFTLLWMFIKPFLSPATANKVRIYGKTGWQEELSKLVNPDQLPKFMGGNLTDPDGNPMCKNFMNFGGPVPEHLYTPSNQSCETRLPGAKKLAIPRMSKEEVVLQVLYPGSTIEWEFVVKSRDISYSVIYKGIGNDYLTEVVPQQRVDTSASLESGAFQCEKPGTYIIEFNNTYSWVHNKEVYYTTSVKHPSNKIHT